MEKEEKKASNGKNHSGMRGWCCSVQGRWVEWAPSLHCALLRSLLPSGSLVAGSDSGPWSLDCSQLPGIAQSGIYQLCPSLKVVEQSCFPIIALSRHPGQADTRVRDMGPPWYLWPRHPQLAQAGYCGVSPGSCAKSSWKL